MLLAEGAVVSHRVRRARQMRLWFPSLHNKSWSSRYSVGQAVRTSFRPVFRIPLQKGASLLG